VKKLIALAVILIMVGTGYVSAVPLFDGVANFLTQSASAAPSDRVNEVAMVVFALSSLEGKLQGSNRSAAIETVENYSRFLVNVQNPDGGWGYYEGSVSNVPSTAYAVIGLSGALKFHSFVNAPTRILVQGAVWRGVSFLRRAFNGEAWGYIPGSPSEFYPTATALWALGAAGYDENDYYVFKGIQFLERVEPKNAEEMALRLIAFHYVGHESEKTARDLGSLEKKVLAGELNTRDMALAVYAISLYRPDSFDTAKALAMLEERAIVTNDSYSWKNEEMFYSDSVLTTAYAVLPYIGFKRGAITSSYGDFLSLLQRIKDAQTESGAWTFGSNVPPCERPNENDAKLTYYATMALYRWEGRNSTAVRKAIDWAKRELEIEMANAKVRGTVTTEYYYVLRLLIDTGSLTQAEKDANVELIKSLQLPVGAWSGSPTGPQPLQTAMAMDLLNGLGVKAKDDSLIRAKRWLLSITPDGWGVYISTPLAGYMVAKDVVTTSFAIKALAPVSNRTELEPHVRWLLEQRLPDGGWAYMKAYYRLYTNRWVELSSSVEPTVLATYALKAAGVDLSNETARWLLSRDLTKMPLYQLSIAMSFLAGRVSPERPSLCSAVSLLYTRSSFILEYEPVYKNVAPEVANVLRKGYGLSVELREGFNFSNTSANYIVIGTYGSVDVGKFNPLLDYEFKNDTIVVDGRSYPAGLVVLVVPGRVGNGTVIAVLASKRNYGLVEALFRTSLIKYLCGHYVILRAVDTNGNGRIDLSEIQEVAEG